MKRLVIVLVLVVAGCTAQKTETVPQGPPASTPQPATFYHDIVHKASCWISPQGDISCIADSQLQAVP